MDSDVRPRRIKKRANAAWLQLPGYSGTDANDVRTDGNQRRFGSKYPLKTCKAFLICMEKVG